MMRYLFSLSSVLPFGSTLMLSVDPQILSMRKITGLYKGCCAYAAAVLHELRNSTQEQIVLLHKQRDSTRKQKPHLKE